MCKVLSVYADETVLNEKGKIDYRVFKPVLFEFPPTSTSSPARRSATAQR